MNGLRWAATPHAPAPTGFLDPLDALVSVSNLPGVFTPVRPWGLTLQGFSFSRIVQVSRPAPAFLTLKPQSRTTGGFSSSRLSTPREVRHPVRAFSAVSDRCPPGLFASPRSFLAVSWFSSNQRLHELHLLRPLPGGEGRSSRQPTARPHRSSRCATFMRFSHLFVISPVR